MSITSNSILLPAGISWSLSDLPGRIRRPLAWATLVVLEDIWLPVLVATPTFLPASNVIHTLWYSGLGSRRIGRSVCRTALTFPGKGLPCPFNDLQAGITYKWQVTVAETGFPGSPRTSFNWSRRLQVANVVGFPGFMFTRAKWISALNSDTSTCLSRSLSPIETPPVVTNKSHCSNDWLNFSVRVWRSSFAIPQSTTLKPLLCTRSQCPSTSQRANKNLAPNYQWILSIYIS